MGSSYKDGGFQAVQAYPRFAHVYRRLDEITDNELTKVVDEGRQLDDFLCKAFQIKKSTFTYMNQMPDEDFQLAVHFGGRDSLQLRLDELYRPESIPHWAPMSMVTLLDGWPDELWPEENLQWRRLCTLNSDAAPILDSVSPPNYIKLVEKSYRSVLDLSQNGSLEGYAEAARYHRDAIGQLGWKLLIPAAVATGRTRPGSFLERKEGWIAPKAFEEVRNRARVVMIRENILDAYRFTIEWEKHHIAKRVKSGVAQQSVTASLIENTPELADPQVAKEVAEANFPLFMLALPSHLRASSPTELIMGPFREAIEPYMVA